MSWRRVHSFLVNTDRRRRDRWRIEMGAGAMSDRKEHKIAEQARQAVFLVLTIN
jgi:hypothetical protein